MGRKELLNRHEKKKIYQDKDRRKRELRTLKKRNIKHKEETK